MDLIDQIVAIEQACFDKPWTYEMVNFEINSPLGVCVYKVDNGNIITYALGRVVAGEAELLRLGTHPDFRRKGLAQQVLSEFLGKIRKESAESCFLEVKSRNSGAISLYKKQGFTQVGLRKKYYGDDDALVLSLDFTENG